MSKRVCVFFVLAAVALAGVVLPTRGDAPARASQSTAAAASGVGEGFSSYRAPTGPELTPLAAATIALSRLRLEERQPGAAAASGEATMTVAHGTLAEAKAVLEGKPPSAAETGSTVSCIGANGELSSCPIPRETAERRQSGAYVVAMAGRRFAPSVPVPPGRHGPTGTVRALVLNSVTGFIEEEYVGSAMPKVSALQDATAFSEGTVAAAAASGRASQSVMLNPRLGYLFGSVYRGRAAAAGWRVHVTPAGSTRGGMVRTTEQDGRFELHILAGRYVVSAQRPGGSSCGTRITRVVPHGVAHVAIVCR
ncbi:MAG TPA: hypothetical protein VKG82_06235 [Solirubrobacteraceae bacterium]|nr:hypothetical protein [Solirubrobacteraceae bacterium]